MVHTSEYVLLSLALYSNYLSNQKEIAEGHKLLPINPKGVMLIETLRLKSFIKN